MVCAVFIMDLLREKIGRVMYPGAYWGWKQKVLRKRKKNKSNVTDWLTDWAVIMDDKKPIALLLLST
jgi:hypothetical protein